MNNEKIKKVTNTKSFIEISERLRPGSFDYSETIYRSYKEEVEIICKKHGKFKTLASTHLDSRNKYGGCPICSRISNNLSIEEKTKIFLAKINYKFPNSNIDFSNTKFLGTKVPTEIVCPVHGKQEIIPNTCLSTSKFICPECGRSSNIGNERSKQVAKENFKEIASKLHNNKYNYDKTVYIDDTTDIIITCPLHGDFVTTPNKHKNRAKGCPVCSESKNSFAEYIFKNLLSNNNIEYVSQFRIEDISNKPFDIYIPKFNLIIELHGLQHFEKRWNMTDDDLKKRIEIDNEKMEKAVLLKYNFMMSRSNSLGKIRRIVDNISNTNSFEDFKEKTMQIKGVLFSE